MNGNGSHLHLVTRTWSARKIAFVPAKGGQSRNYPVAFRNLVFDLVVARGGFLKKQKRLFDTLAA